LDKTSVNIDKLVRGLFYLFCDKTSLKRNQTKQIIPWFSPKHSSRFLLFQKCLELQSSRCLKGLSLEYYIIHTIIQIVSPWHCWSAWDFRSRNCSVGKPWTDGGRFLSGVTVLLVNPFLSVFHILVLNFTVSLLLPSLASPPFLPLPLPSGCSLSFALIFSP